MARIHASPRPADADHASAQARGVLLLSCPDQPGIVAAVSGFIAEHGGNIVDAEQHTDPDERCFFQRVEFDLVGFDIDPKVITTAFEPVTSRFAPMTVDFHLSTQRPRVAVLVSRPAHCLQDLLARWRGGELRGEIVLVISNHPEHEDIADFYAIPYVHLAVTPHTRAAQEDALWARLEEHAIDLVVLARYMQILSPELIGRLRNRVINIHHSFLPAFSGARPYHQACRRGVKLIGATAHYATEDLDEGPIIEQDVVRVTHRDSVDDLIRKGGDLEKIVLARAVRLHLEHRVLPHRNRAIVFA